MLSKWSDTSWRRFASKRITAGNGRVLLHRMGKGSGGNRQNLTFTDRDDGLRVFADLEDTAQPECITALHDHENGVARRRPAHNLDFSL